MLLIEASLSEPHTEEFVVDGHLYVCPYVCLSVCVVHSCTVLSDLYLNVKFK